MAPSLLAEVTAALQATEPLFSAENPFQDEDTMQYVAAGVLSAIEEHPGPNSIKDVLAEFLEAFADDESDLPTAVSGLLSELKRRGAWGTEQATEEEVAPQAEEEAAERTGESRLTAPPQPVRIADVAGEWRDDVYARDAFAGAACDESNGDPTAAARDAEREGQCAMAAGDPVFVRTRWGIVLREKGLLSSSCREGRKIVEVQMYAGIIARIYVPP